VSASLRLALKCERSVSSEFIFVIRPRSSTDIVKIRKKYLCIKKKNLRKIYKRNERETKAREKSRKFV
jgi:hypothetical protein